MRTETTNLRSWHCAAYQLPLSAFTRTPAKVNLSFFADVIRLAAATMGVI